MWKTFVKVKTLRYPSTTSIEEMDDDLNRYLRTLDENSKVIDYEIFCSHTDYYFIYDVMMRVHS